MAENVQFPPCIFKPDDILFTPNFRNTSGGVSLTGASQIIGNATGVWEATIAGSKIRNSRLVQLWELLELRAEGRLNAFIVPVCGRRKLQQKLKDGQNIIELKQTPHSDDAFFSDATGYTQDTMPVITTAFAKLGARSLDIAFLLDIKEMEMGIFFSIGQRLYRISDFEQLGDKRYRITFWPRLREAVANGESVNFSNPVCRMRLKSDTAMTVVKSHRKFAEPDIELIEYL